MTLTYRDLLQHQSLDKSFSYGQDQIILYALGIGLGLDPVDERQLQFVLEDNLAVFPTFASVAAWDIAFVLELGIEWPKLIHLSQGMEIHQPTSLEMDAWRAATQSVSADLIKKMGKQLQFMIWVVVHLIFQYLRLVTEYLK